MRPLLPNQNPINKAARYPQQTGNINCGPSLAFETEHCLRLKIRELGNWMLFPFWRPTAIGVLPTSILRSRDPFKIVRPIVQAVSVDMVDCGIIEIRLAMKRFANQAVNKVAYARSSPDALTFKCSVSRLQYLTFDNRSGALLRGLPDASAVSEERKCSNSSNAGSLEPGQARDGFPNFRIRFNCCISHGVSPHVCGQGRALLTQRFRPAFPSRITICSQLTRAGK